jgi:hypothetical protein
MVLASFWENFFLLLIFMPLLLVWTFSLLDVFRRDDIGGGSKALWLAVVILMPFLGTLIYLLVRPAGATAQERQAVDAASREFVAKYAPDNAAAQLQVLSELHDRGKLTDAEFSAEKVRLLGASPA